MHVYFYFHGSFNICSISLIMILMLLVYIHHDCANCSESASEIVLPSKDKSLFPHPMRTCHDPT